LPKFLTIYEAYRYVPSTKTTVPFLAGGECDVTLDPFFREVFILCEHPTMESMKATLSRTVLQIDFDSRFDWIYVFGAVVTKDLRLYTFFYGKYTHNAVLILPEPYLFCSQGRAIMTAILNLIKRLNPDARVGERDFLNAMYKGSWALAEFLAKHLGISEVEAKYIAEMFRMDQDGTFGGVYSLFDSIADATGMKEFEEFARDPTYDKALKLVKRLDKFRQKIEKRLLEVSREDVEAMAKVLLEGTRYTVGVTEEFKERVRRESKELAKRVRKTPFDALAYTGRKPEIKIRTEKMKVKLEEEKE